MYDMESLEITGLLRAKARVLARVIETVLNRIPTYDDLQKFTRAIIEDDPSKEIILYNNQTIGVIETSYGKKQYPGSPFDVKFVPSVQFNYN